MVICHMEEPWIQLGIKDNPGQCCSSASRRSYHDPAPSAGFGKIDEWAGLAGRVRDAKAVGRANPARTLVQKCSQSPF